MRIIMTGATGFIGKRLLNYFSKQMCCDVTLLSDNYVQKYKCIRHNKWSLGEKTLQDEYDCLVLLGGVTPKGKGNDVESNYVANVISTVNIIEAFSKFPKNIIYISSVSVYVDKGEVISETTDLQTDSLYGLSKLMSEKYLINKCSENGSNLSILRLGQVYGPGEENYNKICGSFIQKAMKNDPIYIKSDGKELRNMIFVDDVARLIALLVTKNYSIGLINVVSNDLISVEELANKIKSITKSNSDINILNECKGHSNIYSCDKIKDLFDRNDIQFTSYQDGLNQTYEYFKEIYHE